MRKKKKEKKSYLEKSPFCSPSFILSSHSALAFSYPDVLPGLRSPYYPFSSFHFLPLTLHHPYTSR
jgi:hypothetical protein